MQQVHRLTAACLLLQTDVQIGCGYSLNGVQRFYTVATVHQ
jgi:hypothetical protein